MTATMKPVLSVSTTVPALARGPVFALAGAVGLLLLVLSGQYGYFGDELYFLSAGRHLAWGYADQPPLLPLLARTMDTIAPGSVTVLRLPAILATAAGVVISALIARELGGARRAQLLAAGAFVACPQFLGTGHYLATSTIDPFLWAVVLFLIVRWVRTRRDGLLVWAGIATGIAVNAKLLIPAFWVVAGICLLIFGPREILRRPALWLGAAIAALAGAPTIIWQAKNGWPQLDMTAAISQEVNETAGGRLGLLPTALISSGIIVGVILLIYGQYRLLRSPHLRQFRFLGWAVIGVFLLFLVLNGRAYYIAGMFPICWAAAAVEIERTQPARWWRWIPTWPVYALSTLSVLPIALPIFPESLVTRYPDLPKPIYSTSEMGWPQFADSIALNYLRIPQEQREHTAVVTDTYWAASAIDYYGRNRGVPRVYSGNRGYWTFGQPTDDMHNVLFVGSDPAPLNGHFTDIQQVGTVEVEPGAHNVLTGKPMWLAQGRNEPWARLWPQFRDVSA